MRDLLANPEMAYWPLVRTEEESHKFFGSVRPEVRLTRGGEDTFYMLGRRFGWAVALTITEEGYVLLNIQPKPGLAAASLEMPAGGIGKDPKRTTEDIIRLTREQVLRETGYGNGNATYLGFSLIETGKMFDPAVEEPYEPGVGRGLKAHCVLFLVEVSTLVALVRDNVLVETSAVNCVALAYMNGHLDQYYYFNKRF